MEDGKAHTLMLFLKMYPGMEKSFFLSMGSLKITSCSNRKTRLSLARDRKPLSCSVTVKVSCWSSLPWAVIFPWYTNIKRNKKKRWKVLLLLYRMQGKSCCKDKPQSLVICPHSSCHRNVLAPSTSPPPLSVCETRIRVVVLDTHIHKISSNHECFHQDSHL